jgi:hypothetical protein
MFDCFSGAKVYLEGKRQQLWRSSEYSLNLKANDDKLNFDNRNLNANDNYSTPLVLLDSICVMTKQLAS